MTALIYGMRLVNESIYRYVGSTSASLTKRTSEHLYDADRGSHIPVHQFIAQHRQTVVFDTLADVPEGRDRFVIEQQWIDSLKGAMKQLPLLDGMED